MINRIFTWALRKAYLFSPRLQTQQGVPLLKTVLILSEISCIKMVRIYYPVCKGAAEAKNSLPGIGLRGISRLVVFWRHFQTLIITK